MEHCRVVGTCIYCLERPSRLHLGLGYCGNCEEIGIPGHPADFYPRCKKCKCWHANRPPITEFPESAGNVFNEADGLIERVENRIFWHHLGRFRHLFSPNQISYDPPRTEPSADNVKFNKDTKECVVCQEKCDQLVGYHCGHGYCKTCIAQLKNCAYCRASFVQSL